MTDANGQVPPADAGRLDLRVVPLLEKLRLRVLTKHGGAGDPWREHWNLTEGDSELHRDAAAEIEKLRLLLMRGDRLMTRWQEFYGDADHCFRNDLPLPPGGQVEWAEDVAEALRHNVAIKRLP